MGVVSPADSDSVVFDSSAGVGRRQFRYEDTLDPQKLASRPRIEQIFSPLPRRTRCHTNPRSKWEISINSKIQAIKADARGFRRFENYRARILFFCGKLELMPTLPSGPTHTIP